MQFFNPAPLVLFGALAVIGLLYYFFIEAPSRKVSTTIQKQHFHESGFIKDSPLATFDYYNDKYLRLGGVFLLLFCISLSVPPLVIPFPYSIMVSTLAMLICGLGVAYLNKEFRERELQAATGREFGIIIAYHRNRGVIPLFVRRIKHESEVVLDRSQLDHILTQACKTIEQMQEFRDAGFNSTASIRTALEARLKTAHAYRLETFDKYRLLLITDAEYNRLKAPNKMRVIDRTMDVEVSLIPIFAVYADTTTRVFQSTGKHGEIEYDSRQMGIYLDMFNVNDLMTNITKGDFDAPDKMTALVGKYLHLFEQQGWTGDKMTKEVRQREAAELESRTQTFKAKAEASKLTSSTEHLLKVVLTVLRGTSKATKFDIMQIAMYILFGALAMYALLVITGRAI